MDTISMLLLLPPSESKSPNSTGNILSSKLFGPDHVARIRTLFENPQFSSKEYCDFSNTLEAGVRYTGVVWKEIDFSAPQLEQILIPNPVLMLSNYYDYIPNYKLSYKLSDAKLSKDLELYRKELLNNYFLNNSEIILDFTTVDIRNSIYTDKTRSLKNIYKFSYSSANKKLLGHQGKSVKGKHVNNILFNFDLSSTAFKSRDIVKLCLEAGVYLTID